MIDTLGLIRAPTGPAPRFHRNKSDWPVPGASPARSRVPNRYVTASELILLTLFLIFSAAFLYWSRARLAIALIAAALLWLIASGWLAAPLIDWIQARAPDTARPRFTARTVIVMLGSGTEHDDERHLVPKRDASARIVKTAALYDECRRDAQRSCVVIASGGNPQRHETSEAENYAPYLRRLKVAANDLQLETTSRNTYENAQNVARMLRQQQYDSLILVTSAYHMPRALLDFQRFGLAPQPVIANTRKARCGVLPRLSNFINANIALHELIGIAQFHLYRALGWF